MTIYPDGIDGTSQLPLVIDGSSPLRAADINNIRNAVIAVETELGINPSDTFGTVKDRLDAISSLIEFLTGSSPINIALDFISGMIETPEDKTYYLINSSPYDGYITSVTTQSTSGTCAATIEINGTPLGGTANSVSSSEDIQSHSSTNSFSSGDAITMVISSNASTADMRFTLNIVRTS